VRVLAMIRPSTLRRAPRLTMEVLGEVERAHRGEVEIVIFGCESEDRQFLELPRNFRWRNAGVINREQVAGLVNEVDVFVDFSEFQAQGLTAMEAMATGAAVVVPRRGGSVAFVRDGEKGLVVDTGSAGDCRAALERLVTDHALRMRLQRRAIRDICDFFPEAGAYRTLEALLDGRERPFRLLRDKHDRSYEPSHGFADELQYRAVETAVAAFPGRLRPEDELKLFELASFVQGPVLEIGTLYGRSAAIIASALKRSGKDVQFVSVDIEPQVQAETRRRLEEAGLADFVSLFSGTCDDFFREHPGFQPALVFIDGDHSYDGVRRDLEALEDHVPTSGLVLFHDFLDERNDDPDDDDYGVTGAVADSWVARDCDFGGTFGACGLFRRRVGRLASVR